MSSGRRPVVILSYSTCLPALPPVAASSPALSSNLLVSSSTRSISVVVLGLFVGTFGRIETRPTSPPPLSRSTRKLDASLSRARAPSSAATCA